MGRGSERVSSRTLRTVLGTVAVIALALVLVAMGTGSQAFAAYNSEELAFVQLLNEYRASQGLGPVLLSDNLSLAAERHASDMAKYGFFSHTSLKSDWFPVGATFGERALLCGYVSGAAAENIAGGQPTAGEVMAAWKGSSGHNANLLRSQAKVVGIGFVTLDGSPCHYYWVADFGDDADSSAHVAPAVLGALYQQTDSRLAYSGTWKTVTTSYASGGSFRYANSSGASVNVAFTGTYVAWIAKKSPVYGKAKLILDGEAPFTIDLYSPSVRWKQKVWEKTLSDGTHTLRIEWTGLKTTGATDTNIGVDAFNVVGVLLKALVPVRYEDSNSRLVYKGIWYTFYATGSSGGSYKRANTDGASVTVTFEGTYLAWIATKGTTLGKALLSLDGGPAVCVNLAASTTQRQQKVWTTGTLAPGTHTVKIWWDPTNLAGKYISIDAFDVIGVLK